MNAPAVLLRRVADGGEAITVAKAPFIILAHGLLTITPEMRDGFWISSPAGDIEPAEVEAVMHDWLHSASAA